MCSKELRFGDNDTLSALVGEMVNASWVFLLTDVDGLYTANPHSDPNAKRIGVVEDLDKLDGTLILSPPHPLSSVIFYL